ncbi:MAG: PQQ-binding-like beta-propeller repeat protein, partial [Bacteroidota bacterium]
DYANNAGVSFIIHTGDICYEKGMNFHGQHVTSETMGVPVFYCVGNHDLEKGKYGEEVFENNFGPVYYSFEAGNTHFIVTPMSGGTHPPSYTTEDVYRWMVNDLKHVDPSKNVVMFNHFIQTSGDEFVYGINDREQIDFSKHQLKAWIYGHHHSNYLQHHKTSGVVSVQSSPLNKGGINHSPSNFLLHTINHSGELKVVPRYNFINNHIGVISPNGNQCALDIKDNLMVSVNTYTTQSETRNVEFRINDHRQWISLSEHTDWNWAGKYPLSDLSKEEPQQITVRVTLENGDSFSTIRYFSLENNDSLKDFPSHKKANNSNGELKEVYTLDWIRNVGANIWMCSPVSPGGVVYVATSDVFSLENNHVSAFDASNGKLRWKHKTGQPVKNNISLHNGYILFTDQQGISYALNADSGELVWRKDLGRNSVTNFISGSIASNGVYYTGYGDYLTSVDITQGDILWKSTSWTGGFGSTANHMIADSILVIGANWQALHGHNMNSGEKIWSVAEENIRYRSNTPVWYDDTLFVAALNSLVKMNPFSGDIYSVHPVPYNLQVATNPLISDQSIILGTSREGMVAFNRNTMDEEWKVKPGEALFFTAPYSGPPSATVESSPVRAGDYIIFGASDGFLYIVDPEGGEVVQKTELGAPVFGSVWVEGKNIFVADFSGNLSKFTVK